MAQFDYEKQWKTIGKVINVKEHAACPVLFISPSTTAIGASVFQMVSKPATLLEVRDPKKFYRRKRRRAGRFCWPFAPIQLQKLFLCI